jgi:hypothetical protein
MTRSLDSEPVELAAGESGYLHLAA